MEGLIRMGPFSLRNNVGSYKLFLLFLSAGIYHVRVVFCLTEPGQVGSVIITRTATTMTVSWRLLTLVEARGFITGYTVAYTVSTYVSRQTNTVTTGPDVSSVAIDGLDANTVYDVSVQASNSAGTSKPAMISAPSADTTPISPPGERNCSLVSLFWCICMPTCS